MRQNIFVIVAPQESALSGREPIRVASNPGFSPWAQFLSPFQGAAFQAISNHENIPIVAADDGGEAAVLIDAQDPGTDPSPKFARA